MAAKKKTKTKSKKKLARKKAARPAAARKKTASKKKAVKKKATKKKVVKKKAVVKKAKTTVKKTAAKKTVSKKSGSSKSVNTPEKKSSPAKQKLSMGKSKKIGSKVKTLTGRTPGERGVIVRQDAYLGTFFIVLDNLQDNPVYRKVEWGPYFESQLEFIKKR